MDELMQAIQAVLRGAGAEAKPEIVADAVRVVEAVREYDRAESEKKAAAEKAAASEKKSEGGESEAGDAPASRAEVERVAGIRAVAQGLLGMEAYAASLIDRGFDVEAASQLLKAEAEKRQKPLELKIQEGLAKAPDAAAGKEAHEKREGHLREAREKLMGEKECRVTNDE